MTRRTAFIIILLVTRIFTGTTDAQIVVGLDNWFNRETNQTTGKPYHYLWSDTAWSGYSRWGEVFTSRGAEIITVGKPDAAALGKVNVYIIVDPDTTTESQSPNYITKDDSRAISKWVKKGGVLAILVNDAPNCEFTNLNKFASRFGITFNHVTLHPVTNNRWEMGACTDLPDHPLFKDITKIYIKEVSSLDVKGGAKSILTEDGNILMAESNYGKGYVFAIGDPWIYNEYIDHDRLPESFQNREAAENLADLLLLHALK